MTGGTRFRFHRGMLSDSLKTEILVPDYDTLKYLVIGWAWTNYVPLEKAEIELVYRGFDNRCGYDEYLVCLNGQAVGMSDGFPKGTPRECVKAT